MKIAKEFSWVPRGAENASKAVFSWVKEPKKKELVLRRLGIVSSVPVGSVILVSQSPSFSIAGIMVASLGVCAWFGYEKSQEIFIHEREYAMPYIVNGEPMTAKEVLRKFVEKNPQKSIKELAHQLSESPGSPPISADLLSRELKFWGIPLPSKKDPSPTDKTPLGSPIEEPSPAPISREVEEGEGNQVCEAGLVNQVDVTLLHDREADCEGDSGEQGTGGVPDERLVRSHCEPDQIDVHNEDQRAPVRSH